MAYARSGGPLYYQAPMDVRATRFIPSEQDPRGPVPYTYKVQARTIKMWPPGSVGRGRQRQSDPFTADAGHLDRFSHPIENEIPGQHGMIAHHRSAQQIFFRTRDQLAQQDAFTVSGMEAQITILRDAIRQMRPYAEGNVAGAREWLHSFEEWLDRAQARRDGLRAEYGGADARPQAHAREPRRAHEPSGWARETNQPEWEEVGTIGDKSFEVYGGGIVSKDRTGAYPPELEYVEPPPEELEFGDSKAIWTIYRVVLDPEVPNWGEIEDVARSHDQDVEELRAAFESDDPMQRAWAYETWAGHYGWHEFDSYPLSLTCAEMNKRYDTDLDCYGVIHEALEKEIQNMIDESAAQGASYLGDQDMMDLEDAGYDDQSAWSIAEFGDAVAVNSETTFGPDLARLIGVENPRGIFIWSDVGTRELVSWLKSEGYEETDRGGQVPDTEGYATARFVIERVARELNEPIERIAEAAAALDDWPVDRGHGDMEIPGSSSGYVTVWAKPLEREEEEEELDERPARSRRRR